MIVSKIPLFFRKPRPGDMVVFEHADYGVLIKQVADVIDDGARVVVLGTQTHSVDSRRFGPIATDALRGLVIAHIRRSPSR